MGRTRQTGQDTRGGQGGRDEYAAVLGQAWFRAHVTTIKQPATFLTASVLFRTAAAATRLLVAAGLQADRGRRRRSSLFEHAGVPISRFSRRWPSVYLAAARLGPAKTTRQSQVYGILPGERARQLLYAGLRRSRRAFFATVERGRCSARFWCCASRGQRIINIAVLFLLAP